MNLLCVLLGGFIGGSLRYGFTRLIPAPYCTFVANILGSLALGLAYGFTQLADVPLLHPSSPSASPVAYLPGPHWRRNWAR